MKERASANVSDSVSWTALNHLAAKAWKVMPRDLANQRLLKLCRGERGNGCVLKLFAVHIHVITRFWIRAPHYTPASQKCNFNFPQFLRTPRLATPAPGFTQSTARPR